MRELIPIKIKATLSKGGNKIDYPKFDSLSREIRKGLKSTEYFDRYGIGMLYDLCGMGEVDDVVSEYDVWYCGTCVLADFATAAVKAFPVRVTILTPEEWEEWYDNRIARDQLDERVDLEVLQGIEVQEALHARGHGKKPDQVRIKKALNPKDKTPGIRENVRKTWARLSKHAGIQLKTLDA